MRISKKDLCKAGEGIIKMIHEKKNEQFIGKFAGSPSGVILTEPSPDPEMMKALDAIPEPKKKSKAKPETKIVHDCMLILQTYHIFAWRNNTGATWMNGRPVFYGLKGSADIIGMSPTGKFLAIEVKSETGKQSDSQKEFEKKVLENNGVYLLVHSAKELNDFILRGI
jgi:hypothetical protein